MLEDPNVRVDKWLWAVRVFKTRSLASEACKKGRVRVNDQDIKPSRTLKVGDVVSVRRAPVNYSYKVLGLLAKRQSAKIVPDYCKNITPEEELFKLEQNLTVFVQRDRGAGRPTKKDRRDIDELNENY